MKHLDLENCHVWKILQIVQWKKENVDCDDKIGVKTVPLYQNKKKKIFRTWCSVFIKSYLKFSPWHPSLKTLAILDKNLEYSLTRFLPRNPRICKILQDRVKEFKIWTDKSEWKQTKTDANCSLISVPIMPQPVAIPTKLSRSEFHYLVLSYIQYFKEW